MSKFPSINWNGKPNLYFYSKPLMTLMTFVQLWNVTRRLCSSTITFPQTRYSTFAKTTLSWWKLWWLSWWSKRWWQWCSYRSAALLKNTKSFWLWWKNVFGWCARSPQPFYHDNNAMVTMITIEEEWKSLM